MASGSVAGGENFADYQLECIVARVKEGCRLLQNDPERSFEDRLRGFYALIQLADRTITPWIRKVRTGTMSDGWSGGWTPPPPE